MKYGPPYPDDTMKLLSNINSALEGIEQAIKAGVGLFGEYVEL